MTGLVDVTHLDVWVDMGEHGRQHVEKEFDAWVQARRLEEAYSAVLERRESLNVILRFWSVCGIARGLTPPHSRCAGGSGFLVS